MIQPQVLARDKLRGCYWTVRSFCVFAARNFYKPYYVFMELSRCARITVLFLSSKTRKLSIVPHYIFGQSGVKSSFDSHYTYQSWWAIKKISLKSPEIHTDFSSSIPFVVALAATQRVNYYEFNKPDLTVPNLFCGECDLTATGIPSNSLESVSCLHVLEHIGLGRYGDRPDPDGHLKAIGELKRVCAPGGNIYISVPVGRPAIYLNAHRVFSASAIIKLFEPLILENYSFIDDGGHLILVQRPEASDGQRYALGLFSFLKPK